MAYHPTRCCPGNDVDTGVAWIYVGHGANHVALTILVVRDEWVSWQSVRKRLPQECIRESPLVWVLPAKQVEEATQCVA